MPNNLILKLKDSSFKECEVTGRELGGDEYYEIPLAVLKPGLLEWPRNLKSPLHSIEIMEVGEDYVTLQWRNVPGTGTTCTLRLGYVESTGYCYGEWAYSCRVYLEEADEDKIAMFTPEYGLAEAVAKEKENRSFYEVKESYEIAARLGSPEAYAWLVKDALSLVMSKDEPQRQLHVPHLYEAMNWLEKAHSEGIGGLAQEVYDQRETFYVVDGVLYAVFRGGETLIVPENVTTIATHAFFGCKYEIDKLVIPSYVIKIENLAFEGCKMVKEVEIQGPVELGEGVFKRCLALEKVTLAPGVVFHEDQLFSSYMNVKVVRLS